MVYDAQVSSCLPRLYCLLLYALSLISSCTLYHLGSPATRRTSRVCTRPNAIFYFPTCVRSRCPADYYSVVTPAGIDALILTGAKSHWVTTWSCSAQAIETSTDCSEWDIRTDLSVERCHPVSSNM
ncbi:hypothetical protein OH76DRAFT_1405730 [Lentinus brumalis]|uniref:Uncharacterized protein n=1 Tax=Lentinus brumalis TaxID=2498619 RepID=A0A371D550_9APHY|nr:hypothetical protein OH76DRAFT_1405730 [Polyporus brumalis]